MRNIASASAIFLSTVLLSALANAQINACGEKCKFRLCEPIGPVLPKGSRILVRPPPELSFGSVCRQGRNIGFVRSTGEAILEFRSGNDTRISQWRPKGLTPRFSKTFFKLGRDKTLKKSGILSAKPRGRQQKFLDNLCVKLPIRSYEIVEPRSGRVKQVVKTKGEDTDCLSFRTRAAKILVELTWDSNDDFDLYVIEPDGKQLSRFNPQTSTGKLNGDFTADGCTRLSKMGRESARYLEVNNMVRNGKYAVEARHFRNCGTGPTKWMLRISINGKLIKTKRGSSNGGVDALVGKTTFNF